MEFLTYAYLDVSRVKRQFDKVQQAIVRDDLRSADVKKLAQGTFFRARLDDSNRLLLKFVRYQGRTVCLALEVIHQHAYEKSRFLRGARIDESKIEPVSLSSAGEQAEPVRYLHPGRSEFHLQENVISFDAVQQAVFATAPPLIVVGSAGSGKTALVLEKLRQVPGHVLFVTQSNYLARAARDLYFAHGHDNEQQEPDFLSFSHFLESLRVPPGRELTFESFVDWFNRQPGIKKIVDAHPLYEEFRGVLTSDPDGPLDRDGYLQLGVKQSIFTAEQRPLVYDLFVKYRAWLQSERLFDSNLIAHEWMTLAQPTYDFVVIDEVQDLTPVQIKVILRTLKEPGQLLLCGDSNQIVHPNFFAWGRVKSLFRADPALAANQRLSLLNTNFRNSREVTRVANALLKVKHARFGSIDRESNFLVQSAADAAGSVELQADDDRTRAELNKQSRRSTRYAVVVLRDADKAEARKVFNTPLIFSVQEAKGLEYERVILFGLVSSNRRQFTEICAGVSADDLDGESLDYRRARDKTDKSLEIYKFYINALYVAVTRAVNKVIWMEADRAHPLFNLLALQQGQENASSDPRETSSRAEWEREAARLDQQGKREQAAAIRSDILGTRPVPWEPFTRAWAAAARERVLGPTTVGGKVVQQLYNHALWHEDAGTLEVLSTRANHPGARHLLAGGPKHASAQKTQLRSKILTAYGRPNFKSVLALCDQYGVDMLTQEGSTPLMLAAMAGNVALCEALLDKGANVEVVDDHGHTALFYALCRARSEPAFAKTSLGPIWELLHPRQLDVQVDGRLVRLLPSQAEYFLLTVMLASLKNLASYLTDAEDFDKRATGMFVDFLMKNVEHMPHVVFPVQRRRRPYINHVLARAEVDSNYTPRRCLWRRVRLGLYLPNSSMQLRLRPVGKEEPEWVALAAAMPRYVTDLHAYLRSRTAGLHGRAGLDHPY